MLTIDVGNTSVGVGRWTGDTVSVTTFAEPEDAARVVDGTAVVISVSARRLSRLQSALAAGIPLRVLSGAPLPVCDPRLLAGTGADRWAGVLAVAPGPAIVVDAGTALTVDLVDEGVHLGGFIAAGPQAILRGLHVAGEALPLIEGGEYALDPGLDTLEALRAGAWGQALGAADRLVDAALKRLPQALIVCTGGWGARWAASSGRTLRVEPQLVHEGIRRWARRG